MNQDTTIIYYTLINSPFGKIFIGGNKNQELCFINFGNIEEKKFKNNKLLRDECLLKSISNQILLYFEKKLLYFDVKLDISYLTLFEQKVLNETIKIPYGKVITYKKLAEKLGITKGWRAIGNALGKNPIPIIIPCHRVIRSDKSLGGYSAGLEYKVKLLKLEGINDYSL